MSVLVDTNVWLDVLLHRKPFESLSKALLMACLNDDIPLAIVSTSVKDIFYIMERAHDADNAYWAVESVLALAAVSSVDAVVCERALDLERPDYEDGIIAAAALADKHDAIVSRDERAFRNLSIPRFTPQGFLEHLGYEDMELPWKG